MKNLETGNEYIPKVGDIIKKDTTSRQSWLVEEIDGKLMAVPNINKYFTDPTPVELTGNYHRIAEVRDIDWESDSKLIWGNKSNLNETTKDNS